MSRKQPKRKAGSMVVTAIAGIFIAALIGGVSLGVASADSSDDLARSGAFGFTESTQQATKAAHNAPLASVSGAEVSYSEQSILAAPSKRDISAGLRMIDDKERKAAERVAAEEAAIAKRVAAAKEMQGVSPASDGVSEYGLPAVDWSVGKQAFLAEWTARIDAYLAGSPLEGYGSVFAEAAWDNAVDPRWSPAISNTESGKGSVCFLPYNAWGWGRSSWSDWDTAIRSHVAGLAEGYGYSITLDCAYKYCWDTYTAWYDVTHSQMELI